MKNPVAAAMLSALLACPAEVFAQDEPEVRFALQAATKLGDKLTIAITDATELEGRLLRLDTTALVLDTPAGTSAVAYDRIERARSRKNGIRTGAVIGVPSGLACGLVMENSVGSATTGFNITAASVAAGTGIGIGIDALLGSNRTVFRRSPADSHGIVLQLQKGGGAIGWSAAW